jgi:short-subunit dehydrogenase
VTRVLVAGATGALGGAIARELAGRGAALALHGRDAARLEALAGELGAAGSAAADLTGAGEADRVVEAAVAALGGLDALVCAVGVVAFGSLRELDDATLERLVAVNLVAPVRLARAAAARMERGAAIVNVSAITAEMPTAGMAAYSASKAALTAFDRAAARELRRDGIRLVDVRPPHLDTGLETRPIAGTAPRLAAGRPAAEWARRVADAVEDASVTEVGSDG